MIIDDTHSNFAGTPTLARRWWRFRRDDHAARTTVRGLDALNDHLLRDIGLRRTWRAAGDRHPALWP